MLRVTLPLRLTFDPEADMAYLYLTRDEAVVARTIGFGLSAVDVDDEGRFVGFEIHNARDRLPAWLLKYVTERIEADRQLAEMLDDEQDE